MRRCVDRHVRKRNHSLWTAYATLDKFVVRLKEALHFGVASNDYSVKSVMDTKHNLKQTFLLLET